MRDVYVLGIGQTKFGVFEEYTGVDLGVMASVEAVKDAGISAKEIQVAYAGYCRGPSTQAQMAFTRLGIGSIPIANLDNACASGNTAIHMLYRDIAGGFCEVGLAAGFESLTQASKQAGKGLLAIKEDFGGMMGLTMPGFFSFVYQRLMDERGATMEDLCYPAIKNHYNAQFNPLAQYNKPLTYEQIMASPVVVDPITVLQCCPQSDGGAAVILCSEEYFKKHNVNNQPKIRIAASVVHSSGWLSTRKDPLFSHVNREAADKAYHMAGIDPKDLDFAEIHDAFSGEEVAAYEPMRFCPEGECIKYVRERYFDLNGKFPINTSGGLLSLGHPLGASGARVNCEVTRQLRNQAGGYQVEGARIGLAQMLGSVLFGGNESAVVCGIQILERVD
ncbi:MAG: thiolase family protein [Deltaproteobacteria bacterium]|nr:thiolase family protein [Deltaproteobacteria bacterium]MBW1922910.1 thiolase family protein [Deltaproteobacteria bacterium]MBW1949237.1 thiolase family protein [Deltaproteobacteria bacterium]MBW2006888.1 thiolase family protein [Deltaproteobacteria bacterium]MBW2101454.1 thiolase family protein [Deltaproteobacteria bacterium]